MMTKSSVIEDFIVLAAIDISSITFFLFSLQIAVWNVKPHFKP